MAALHTGRRLKLGVVAGVLALHLLLLAGLQHRGAWRDRGPAVMEQPALVVRLLQAAPATPMSAPRQPVPPPPRHGPPTAAQPGARPAARPAALSPETQAITVPAQVREAPAASGPAVPETPAATPLNLDLPRGASAPWRLRNAALDDPRANTPRATLESRLAEVLGGPDHITEERLDDGRVRFRRGSSCVVVHPNRAQRLDPWNSSVFPKARGVEKC